MNWLPSLLLVAIFFVFTATGLAQTTSGRFVVTVKDETGAVISGATVKITNSGTAQEITGTANGEGVFTTNLLPVGKYEIRVEATNFLTAVLSDIKLDVGQEYGVVVSLRAGGGGDIVTVSGGEQLVQSTNAEVRNTITSRQTQELPLAARNPLSLIQLQAGVSGNQARTNTVINGQRSSTTIVTQDGINIQDNLIRSNTLDFSPNLPTVASVAEATVITSNATADVGGSSAVRFVTPSGTKEYHGEVFLFHRNSATAANSFFNNAQGVARPQLIRNQFGYTFGGPVGIPGLGKVKNLFFFSSYEGFRQRTQAALNTTVLTPDARAGRFTYVDNSGVTRTLDLLATRNFAIDPVIAGLINRSPTSSNNTDVGDGFNTRGFRFNRSTPTNRNAFTVRVDWTPNEKHRVEAIYRYSKEIIARGDIDQTFNTNLQVNNTGPTNFGVVAWNWNITSNLTNEVRFGTNLTDPAFNVTANRPNFFVGGLQFTNPDVTFLPQGRTTRVNQIIDNATYTVGNHSLRFGVQLDYYDLKPFNDAGIVPTLTVGQGSPVFTNAANNFPLLTAANFPGGINPTQLVTANNFLAMYAGAISAGAVTYNAQSVSSGYVLGATNFQNTKFNQMAGYITDQWRVHPRLTANVGLRYDYITPIREVNGFVLFPDRTGASASNLLLDPLGSSTSTRGFVNNPDRNNFAPNINVAWDIPGLGDRQTVLRGGYSITYVNDEVVQGARNSVNTNSGLSSTVNTTVGSIAAANANPRLGTAAGQIISGPLAAPTFLLPLSFAAARARFGPGTAFGMPDLDLQTPSYQQWNVALERELTKDIALTVRYVGNRSTNLVRGIDLNQVILSPEFLADFRRAQSNGFLSLTATGVFNPAFNSSIAGSQQLTVLPNFNLNGSGAGFLTNGTVRANIQQGAAGGLAGFYVGNGITNPANVLNRQPNGIAANLLGNSGFSNYHALQVEVRRRFAKSVAGDFGFQANYTWSKTLTNTQGTGQTRFEALLDNNQPTLENSRALFDTPHAFKINGIYELPFGPGKTFNPGNRVLSRLVEGFQISTFYEIATGAPFSIFSGRGTVNRVTAGSRGDLTTANSSLTAGQIRDLFGFFQLPPAAGGTVNRLFFINPNVINVGLDGRAVAPDGQAAFNGQVFFNPNPGQAGQLQRLLFNGPLRWNWDLSIIKRTRITERVNTEFRAEFFNILNTTIFDFGDQNINSATFGRITGQYNTPRFIQFAFKISF